MIDEPQTLHEKITSILLDNGAAVTKTSVDAIIKYIAERDEATIARIIRGAESDLRVLQGDGYFGTRIKERGDSE